MKVIIAGHYPTPLHVALIIKRSGFQVTEIVSNKPNKTVEQYATQNNITVSYFRAHWSQQNPNMLQYADAFIGINVGTLGDEMKSLGLQVYTEENK